MHGNARNPRVSWFHAWNCMELHGIAWKLADHMVPCMEQHSLMNTDPGSSHIDFIVSWPDSHILSLKGMFVSMLRCINYFLIDHDEKKCNK